MALLSRHLVTKEELPSRILQFGQGNFLRAFIGGRIEALNQHTSLRAGITIVRRSQPEPERDLNTQDALYTIVARGIADHESSTTEQQIQLVHAVNRCISIQSEFDDFLATASDAGYRFIFSNNTEMGIEYDAACQRHDRPARSFPAKLTQWLCKRFEAFQGSHQSGVYIIPCELFDNNGETLKKYILQHAQQWQVGDAFAEWIHQSCYFYNTLVDQIVTGYPEDAEELASALHYTDRHLTATELYSEFVLSGPDHLKEALCLEEYEALVEEGSAPSLRMALVDDVTPYAERKIRLLNGSHSAMVPLALQLGLDIVRESVAHPLIGVFVNRLMEYEIMPLLKLPKNELMAYKQQIIARFLNPTIDHKLLSITLNSITKYRTRLVPLVQRHFIEFQAVPVLLSLAFAGQLLLLRGDILGTPVELKDDASLLSFIAEQWRMLTAGEIDVPTFVHSVFASEAHWGMDLNQFSGWGDAVSQHLESLLTYGAEVTLKQVFSGNACLSIDV